MAGPGRRTRLVVMSLAATIGIALAIGWTQQASRRAADETETGGAVPASAEFVHIDAGGRQSIDHASLPRTGPVRVVLDLVEEARGDGRRAVILVSADGRRWEAETRPADGAEGGVELDVDPAFLVPGRYLIQVATAENHPLSLRRYVLEID